MTLDAAKGEASFALMVAGAPAEPALAHLHATDDSTFNLSIQPLPSKDGRALPARSS
jgi:hypothetical protein